MDAMWIVADVVFDTDEDAREAERLAREGKLAGVSVDLVGVTSEIEIRDIDEDGFPTDWLETITQAEIIGATQVAMPAFADARIEATDSGFVAFLAPEGIDTSDRRHIAEGALVWRDNAPLMFNDTSDGHEHAVHVGNLVNFRRGFASFSVLDAPELHALTKPRIRDGRMEGHGAGWGTCHTAFKDVCITAPQADEYFEAVPIYSHPNGDVHAPLTLALEDAEHWYDTHCELVGMAAVGEDAHGIWVAGETSLEEGEVFLSGDWRDVDGAWNLISFLVVENPGFPTALVADGVQKALVGAGMFDGSRDPILARVDHLEAQVEAWKLDREAERLARAFS